MSHKTLEEDIIMQAVHNVESVTIPKELLDSGATTQFIKEAVTATLFYQHKLSGKQACDILGVNRRDWEENILHKFGYTTMRDVNDAENEIQASHR